MYPPGPNNGPYQESHLNHPCGTPQEPYENYYGTFQPRQDTNQEYSRLGYPSEQTYGRPTNVYQQANRAQYSVQRIPPYQGQQQQQQPTYPNVDCKPTILQYPIKLAGKTYINLYAQQHGQPAAHPGQQDEHSKKLYDDQQAFNKYCISFQQDEEHQEDNIYNGPNNHKQEQHDNNINANHIKICSTTCRKCHSSFASKNALHKHF